MDAFPSPKSVLHSCGNQQKGTPYFTHFYFFYKFSKTVHLEIKMEVVLSLMKRAHSLEFLRLCGSLGLHVTSTLYTLPLGHLPVGITALHPRSQLSVLKLVLFSVSWFIRNILRPLHATPGVTGSAAAAGVCQPRPIA